MEPDPVKKTGLKVLEFEKHVIEPESKGSKYGRTWFKPLPEEPPHKILNVKTRPEVVSKQKNRATLVRS